MNPGITEAIGAALFAIAIAHTFATHFFTRLAQQRPTHGGLWHLLGEVEVVFGFWASVLMVVMFVVDGSAATTRYLEARNFTEPMFVFAVMVVAATRPILHLANASVRVVARLLPAPHPIAIAFTTLTLAPLSGSLITEPAAMTLAALMLRDQLLARPVSPRLKYAVLGVLFVNVSIGGTLTPFAAPPVLMVAHTWQWDLAWMLSHFGWKAAIAVIANALGVVLVFRRELVAAAPAESVVGAVDSDDGAAQTVVSAPPLALVLVHVAFLAAIVAAAHHAVVFLALFLLFLGVSHAYPRFQDRLVLREAMLVGYFLAGLVVLGAMQRWWLQPLLVRMTDDVVFAGAMVLTAFTDNAALTYLGSLVEGLPDKFKYLLVAGAVAGGGMTIIANAPNPAGIAILRDHFPDGAVKPLDLALAALLPTLVAAAAFRWL